MLKKLVPVALVKLRVVIVEVVIVTGTEPLPRVIEPAVPLVPMLQEGKLPRSLIV